MASASTLRTLVRGALASMWFTGCIGVHLAHAPAVPYPITEADLAERPPAPPAGRLPAGFQIPTLTSVAPDPIAVEFGANRHVLRADVLDQRVPTTLNDAFHANVGGDATGSLPVTIVIERLYTGCYPVNMGAVAAGEYAFVEAYISFGPAGGERVRFATHDAACGSMADDQLAALGASLAAEAVQLAREVR